MASIRDGKLLYHLTTLDVFESIVTNGLMSRGELNRQNLSFVDTANHEILAGRERLGLSDYVPFHFHIHTNYDTYVKDHNKNKTFLYLCLQRSYAKTNGFMILPIHPTSTEQPQMFTYEEGFSRINWNVMELKKSDPFPAGVTEKQRGLIRMAECLSPHTIPITRFISIAVKDDEARKQVVSILGKHHITTNPPYIDIKNYF